MWSKSTSRLRALEIAPTLNGTSHRMTFSKQTIQKNVLIWKQQQKPPDILYWNRRQNHQTYYTGTEDKRKDGTQDHKTPCIDETFQAD